MNTEEVAEVAKQIGMKEGREEGKCETTVVRIRKMINVLRRLKHNPQQILQELEQDYGDDFSKAELENFIKNV